MPVEGMSDEAVKEELRKLKAEVIGQNNSFVSEIVSRSAKVKLTSAWGLSIGLVDKKSNISVKLFMYNGNGYNL